MLTINMVYVEEFIITTPFLVEICCHLIYWGASRYFREKFDVVFLKIVNCDFD